MISLKKQVRIIITMLAAAMLIAAGILYIFPAHAGVSCWTYKTADRKPGR
jgi:hypothetical protein